MYKYLFFSCICFFIVAPHHVLQGSNKLSPQQQLEYFQLQIDTATQERNAVKIASIYEKIVNLCRNTSALKDKLPENLYQYGMWSSYAGDYQTSIHSMIELLDMLDNQDGKLLKARANMNLGVTYFFMERWDDALVYYQKAKEMALELGDKHGLSIAENNIGNIYQKQSNFQQAIEQYQHSLELQKEIEDKETICNTYYNIGTCYRELGNHEESLPYFDLALNLAKEIGDIEIQTLSLIELAHYNAIVKRQYREAEQQINEAENLAEEAGFKQVLAEVYKMKSLIEEEKRNLVTSLEYYKKYKQLSDILFKEHSAEKLHEYEVRYQTQEKQLEIERQQTEISKQQSLLFLFIIGLGIALIIVVLLFFIIRLSRKRNRELKEINITKDKFFSIISHDLRTPALAQRNALQLLSKNAHSWDADTLKQFYDELLKSADYQVELLSDLLNWTQVQTGRMPYNPIIFDLTEALRTEIAIAQSMAAGKRIEFMVQIPEHTLLLGDRSMLITVIRNLTTNAIKFTNEGGKVLLNLRKEDKKSIISISDTGIGMSAEQMQNLFRLNKQQSKVGTAGEQGSGLGLIVCKELIRKHKSVLHIESTLGEGSRFWFELEEC